MATARKTTASKPVKTVNEAKQNEALHDVAEDEAPRVNTFEYKGETYSVPADPMDLPLEVALADSEFEVVQAIVGDEQWIKFRQTRPSIRDFGDFADLVMKAAGYEDSGN